jgi:hypothetical protein
MARANSQFEAKGVGRLPADAYLPGVHFALVVEGAERGLVAAPPAPERIESGWDGGGGFAARCSPAQCSASRRVRSISLRLRECSFS